MNASTITTTEQPSDDASEPSGSTAHRHRGRRWAVLGIAAGLAIIAAVAIASNGDGADEQDLGETTDTVLELSAGNADGLASCLMFDVAILRDMSPAFAATATAVDGELAVLHVDRWYAGDAAAVTVELRAPTGLESLIGGFPIEVGQRYLITAAEGVVNHCGFSGPATPELTQAFDSAFGS